MDRILLSYYIVKMWNFRKHSVHSTLVTLEICLEQTDYKMVRAGIEPTTACEHQQCKTGVITTTPSNHKLLQWWAVHGAPGLETEVDLARYYHSKVHPLHVRLHHVIGVCHTGLALAGVNV